MEREKYLILITDTLPRVAHAHNARIPWCFTYVTHSEEGRVMREELRGMRGGSRWRWQGLRQGWRGLEIAEIQNIFFSPLNCHSINVLRVFLCISILHSFALFCTLLQSAET